MFKIAEKSNIAVISIGYRLAPGIIKLKSKYVDLKFILELKTKEYPYPQQIEDCWTVIDYVIYNSKELGIDQNKIIFSGDSAGKIILTFVF